MNSSILARLRRSVEKPVLAIAAGALVIGASWAISADAYAEERDEPDPWPQVDVPAQSDYFEAKQLLAKRKWQEAAIVLRAVLKKSPDLAPASLELARALAYSGRREEALGVLGQAINRERGARKAAIIRRSRVLSRTFLTDKTFQIHQDGVNLILARKYRLARDRFEKALEQEPDNVEVLTRLGQAMLLENDVDSAAERLRIARRLDPYDPEIRLWLGRALYQRGELNAAVDELRSGYNEMEGSELAPLWLAEALASLGQRNAAAQLLEDDTEAQPFHLAALVALARYRVGQGVTLRDQREELMAAKKDLQLAMSRLPQYRASEAPRAEGEMGLDLSPAQTELKPVIDKLLGDVEGRLRVLSVR